PLTFTIDLRTCCSTACDIVEVGNGPGSGGVSSGPSADGYGASEIERPQAANRAGCVGAKRSIAPTSAEPRAMRAGQPCAVASDGMTIHTRTRTPTTPTAAPAARSHTGNGPSRGDARCAISPAPRPSACPNVASNTRNNTATVTRSSADVPP